MSAATKFWLGVAGLVAILLLVTMPKFFVSILILHTFIVGGLFILYLLEGCLEELEDLGIFKHSLISLIYTGVTKLNEYLNNKF